MFGIPVEEPSYMYDDKQSVLTGSTRPESTLKKKAQSIAFHFIREGCAADEWRHRWELPGNYPVFTVVMLIYHYVERI